MIKCLFYECRNPVEVGSAKCVFHRNRSQCNAGNCRNQAYARGRCVRHGARKNCLMEGCTHYRRAGGYCARHTTELRKNNQEMTTVSSNIPMAEKMQAYNALIEPLAFVLESASLCLDGADWAVVRDLLCDDDKDNEDKLDWTEVSDLLQNTKDSVASVDHSTCIRV